MSQGIILSPENQPRDPDCDLNPLNGRLDLERGEVIDRNSWFYLFGFRRPDGDWIKIQLNAVGCYTGLECMPLEAGSSYFKMYRIAAGIMGMREPDTVESFNAAVGTGIYITRRRAAGGTVRNHFHQTWMRIGNGRACSGMGWLLLGREFDALTREHDWLLGELDSLLRGPWWSRGWRLQRRLRGLVGQARVNRAKAANRHPNFRNTQLT